MRYDRIHKARFLSRPNRFIAHVDLEGRETVCHVKNTGRCRELLVPGATVYLQESANPARKTRYDLVTVQKGERLINMDSQAPNRIFGEWVAESGHFGPLSSIRREVAYGASRLDFLLEGEGRDIYAEVKGVTLEEDGVVLFPDAPTQRGIKHLEELGRAVGEGFRACAVFIVQMKGVRYFTPNRRTHPAFGEALEAAVERGVELLALDCLVEPGCVSARDPVEIRLRP